MTMYGRSLTEIVGWALDGEVFCLGCVADSDEPTEDKSPVFLEYAGDNACDGCHEYLDDDYEPEPELAKPPYPWTFKIHYVEPDVSCSEPERGVGDELRLTVLLDGKGVEDLYYALDETEDMLTEIDYWLYEEHPTD